MKKLLIATAAMALVAGTAQAASSVTIYGIVDLGVGVANGVGSSSQSITGLVNGGLSTPRLGFKGTEDLGGGLAASFVLEQEVLADTGAGATNLFERGSFVTLSKSGAGSISLGRQNYDEYATGAGFDPFGGNNIGGWIAQAQYGSARFDNGITLESAAVNGFKVKYQYSFGEAAGSTSKSKAESFGLHYASGPFAASVIHSQRNSSAGAKDTATTAMYAKYDTSFGSLRAGTTNLKGYVASALRDQDSYFIGGVFPVNARVNVMAIHAWHQDMAGGSSAATGKDAHGTALGATYSMSKRTTLYAIGAMSRNNSLSALNVVSTSKWGSAYAPDAGNDQNAYTVGIRHTF